MPASTVLIGLDGATFNLIRPLVAAGKLPVLASLIDRGVAVDLQSTLPPVTFPAWSTILTGRSPARHGLVDFTIYDNKRAKLRFASAADREGPTLFRLASDAGRRVASIGFPTTYPPERLNGLVVGGFDSPLPKGMIADAVYPSDTLKSAVAECGPYLTTDIEETRHSSGWHRRALERLLLTSQRRADICRHLLDRQQWDLFAVHFGEADTCCHHFWAICDPASPRHVPDLFSRFGNAIELVYRSLDAAVGRIAKSAGKQALICLVSDHGFGGVSDRVVYLNRYLEQCGLLSFKKAAGRQMTVRRLKQLGLTMLPGSLQSAVLRQAQGLANRLETAVRTGPIDYTRTTAWSEELPYFPAVRLNVRGHDPRGRIPPDKVEQTGREVIQALTDLIDPIDGRPVFRRVIFSSEVVAGPYLDRYPEIICLPRYPDGYAYFFGKTADENPAWFARMSPADYLGLKGSSMNGSHRPEGIFILAGPGAGQGGKLDRAAAADVAPTLLHLMGLPILAGMDGRALTEALDQSAAERSVQVTDDPPGTYGDQASPSGERDQAVAQRLRSLGYL